MIPAARVAWLQLRRRRGRFAVAVAGVAFAVVLMSMQVGFRDALFRSAVSLHRHLVADVVLLHPHYNVINLPPPFPRRRLYQALGFDGVASVTPLYMQPGRWKNPVTGRGRDVFVVGIDPAADALDIPEVARARALIRYPDTVLYDERSRPEFGPVAGRVRAGETVAAEVGGHRVVVAGLFPLGVTFGIEASIVTSAETFHRMFPQRTPGSISIGLVRLRPGVDVGAVRDALAAAVPRDVVVLSRQEYMDREVNHWATATPIGWVFSFGVVMGLVVGAIIVYQILFADITEHLPEYATLKAMGYPHRYLVAVVLAQALILAAVGYAPGLACSMWGYRLTARATMLPMGLTPARGALVFGLTVLMCSVSGLIAIRRLRAADPAEVF